MQVTRALGPPKQDLLSHDGGPHPLPGTVGWRVLATDYLRTVTYLYHTWIYLTLEKVRWSQYFIEMNINLYLSNVIILLPFHLHCSESLVSHPMFLHDITTRLCSQLLSQPMSSPSCTHPIFHVNATRDWNKSQNSREVLWLSLLPRTRGCSDFESALGIRLEGTRRASPTR